MEMYFILHEKGGNICSARSGSGQGSGGGRPFCLHYLDSFVLILLDGRVVIDLVEVGFVISSKMILGSTVESLFGTSELDYIYPPVCFGVLDGGLAEVGGGMSSVGRAARRWGSISAPGTRRARAGHLF